MASGSGLRGAGGAARAERPARGRRATPGVLERTCRHVLASAAAAGAEYEVVALAAHDAEDCWRAGGENQTPEVWRSSIRTARASWGHRTRNEQRELVSTTMLYVAAATPGSPRGHCSVSNVITHEDHRRRGLAKELMVALMQAADGAPTSLYSSDMGRPLYESLGYRQLETVRSYGAERACDATAAANAASVAAVAVSVGLPTAAEIDAVVPLDTAMFGGVRTAVLHTAFAAELLPALAVARDSAGEVVAFAGSAYLSADSDGDPLRVFGPVVAESAAGALAVLAALLADHGAASASPSPAVLTVRDSQTSFIHGLTGLGFVAVEDSEMPAMMANSEAFPGKREMYVLYSSIALATPRHGFSF